MGALLLPSLLTPWAPIAGSSAAPASRGSEAPEVLCCSSGSAPSGSGFALPMPHFLVFGWFLLLLFLPVRHLVTLRFTKSKEV